MQESGFIKMHGYFFCMFFSFFYGEQGASTSFRNVNSLGERSTGMSILLEYGEIYWDLPFLKNLGNLEYLKNFQRLFYFRL